MTGPLGSGPLKLQRIRSGHEWLMRGLSDAIAESAQRGGEEATAFVRSDGAGFTHRTGAVKRGQGYRVIRTKSGALLKVLNRAPHARPLERGSRPHRITARRAKALRFQWRGGLRFYCSVWHPGTQPTWFLRKASERGGVRVQNELQGRMNRLALAFRRRR